MSFIQTFFLILMPLLLVVSTVSQSSSSPSMVVELFRHGARGPTSSTYDKSWSNNSYGELTPDGMRQHFTLGTQLAQNYNSLLSSYDPESIYIRSCDANRTIMSAQSHLLGIFQFGTGPDIPSTVPEANYLPPYNISTNLLSTISSMGSPSLPLAYQPVPIHVVEAPDDYLLYSSDSGTCPISSSIVASSAQNQSYVEFAAVMNSTLYEFTNVTGLNTTLTEIYKIFDTLHCDAYAGKQFPTEFENITYQSPLWNNISFIHDYLFFYENAGSPEFIQLFSFNMLSQLVEYFNGYVAGESSPQFVVWSAHDTTMAPLLAALNITNTTCLMSNFLNQTDIPSCVGPEFAASLIFEFYNESVPQVAVYYNDILQNVCGTQSGMCTLAEFTQVAQSIMGNLTENSFLEICLNGTSNASGNSSNSSTNGGVTDNSQLRIAKYAVTVIFVISALALGVGVVTILKKQKQGKLKNWSSNSVDSEL